MKTNHTVSEFNVPTWVDNIPALIVIYNVINDEYVYVNKWVNKLLNRNPTDFIGMSVKELCSSVVYPSDAKKLINRNKVALNIYKSKSDDDAFIATIEYRIKHSDGSYIWVRSDSRIYDTEPGGKVSHIISILTDVTDNKEGELRLIKHAKDLQQMAKAKDDFITIASHQLRTPATAVKQYLGLLLGGYSDPLTDDQKSFIEKAYESNIRQLEIVEDILRTAQLDADKVRLRFVEHSISNLVEASIKNIDPQFKKKNQTVEWEKPPIPINAKVDKGQMLMVLDNILENACHYSQAGKKIQISLATANRKLFISIIDEGVGIQKNDLNKLFKKFSRITNPLTVEAGGSGLGLYWADQIVKMHKGEIKVKSTINRGTEFTIVLPLSLG